MKNFIESNLREFSDYFLPENASEILSLKADLTNYSVDFLSEKDNFFRVKFSRIEFKNFKNFIKKS